MKGASQYPLFIRLSREFRVVPREEGSIHMAPDLSRPIVLHSVSSSVQEMGKGQSTVQ